MAMRLVRIKKVRGQRDGLVVVKSTCCSFRRPEFSSWHLHQAAYNCFELQFQGTHSLLLTSLGTRYPHSTRTYIHVSKTNTHTGKIKMPIKREESPFGRCGCGAATGSPFRFSLPILSSATGNVGILQLLLHGQGTTHLLALSAFQSSHLCYHAPIESLCAQNSS